MGQIWNLDSTLFILGSLIFGVLWFVFKKDIQGAFGNSKRLGQYLCHSTGLRGGTGRLERKTFTHVPQAGVGLRMKTKKPISRITKTTSHICKPGLKCVAHGFNHPSSPLSHDILRVIDVNTIHLVFRA